MERVGEIAKYIHQWSAQGQGLFEQVSGYIQEVYGFALRNRAS